MLYFLVIIIIIGALLGGKTFGETLKKGCGFIFIMIILLALGIGLLFYYYKVSDKAVENENHKTNLSTDNSTYFIAQKNCRAYQKPDIQSKIIDSIEIGEDFFVKETNKFIYFYKVEDAEGKILHIQKECLKKK